MYDPVGAATHKILPNSHCNSPDQPQQIERKPVTPVHATHEGHYLEAPQSAGGEVVLGTDIIVQPRSNDFTTPWHVVPEAPVPTTIAVPQRSV